MDYHSAMEFFQDEMLFPFLSTWRRALEQKLMDMETLRLDPKICVEMILFLHFI
jgi:hypothetical protein